MELNKNQRHRLQNLTREVLEERFIELLEIHEHQSIEMSKINNIIQPFWRIEREKREDYQTVEQFLLRPEDGLKWCIVCRNYVDQDDTHTTTEYNDANYDNLRRKGG